MTNYPLSMNADNITSKRFLPYLCTRGEEGTQIACYEPVSPSPAKYLGASCTIPTYAVIADPCPRQQNKGLVRSSFSKL